MISFRVFSCKIADTTWLTYQWDWGGCESVPGIAAAAAMSSINQLLRTSNMFMSQVWRFRKKRGKKMTLHAPQKYLFFGREEESWLMSQQNIVSNDSIRIHTSLHICEREHSQQNPASLRRSVSAASEILQSWKCCSSYNIVSILVSQWDLTFWWSEIK